MAAAMAVLSASNDTATTYTIGGTTGSEEERRRAAVAACLVTSEQESSICAALVEAGARDGITREQELSVDGMPLAVSLGVLEDLRRIALASEASAA